MAAEQSPSGLLLQLSPNDKPPFQALCADYAVAAGHLGLRCETIFLDAPSQPASAADRAEVHYLEQPAGSHRRDGQALGRRLASLTTDAPALVLCHRYRSYRAALAAKLKPAQMIAVAHEFGWMARWTRRLDYRLRGREVRFAGVSPPVAEELQSVTGHALTLPNLIDTAALTRDALSREAAREALGIRDDRFCIGVVGRLHRKKQPERALAAFRALAQEGQSAELLFIGSGELETTLRAASSELPVRFAGFVPQASRSLRGLDCLLMTSSAQEAFGMVALEALTLGVPVAAPRVPGIESVLGELGFYGDAKAEPSSMARAIMQAMMLTAQPAIRSYRAAALGRVRREFSISAAARRLEVLCGQRSG